VSFSISFLDEPLEYPYDNATVAAAVGELVLGGHRENFRASLYLWSKLDYEAQWRNAIEALLGGIDKSALIVEYVGPESSICLEWWPMYRLGDVIHIQDHLLFYDQLPEPFSLEKASSFIRDRRTVDEDGNPISEWNVSLSEVENFAHGFRRQ